MKNKLNLWPLIIALLLALSPAQLAGAEGGQSSSPGAPGQKPLSLVNASLTDGGDIQNAANVPLQPKFKIVFDKNVVNSTVWNNNRQCFSLSSTDQPNIPITVTKVDDTIDFSQRQNIYIQPVSPLSPGTTYQLVISPNLQAKNAFSTLGGTTGGQGITLAFKTAGAAPAKISGPETPAVPSAPAAEPGPEPDKPTPAAPDPTKETGSEPAGENALVPDTLAINPAPASPADKQPEVINWYTVLAAGLITGWLIVEYFLKRRKK